MLCVDRICMTKVEGVWNEASQPSIAVRVIGSCEDPVIKLSLKQAWRALGLCMKVAACRKLLCPLGIHAAATYGLQYAGLVKLVATPGLSPDDRNIMRVRVSHPAPQVVSPNPRGNYAKHRTQDLP